MTKAEEAAFEKKSEAFFRSHRELPTGRNFLCFAMRYRDKNDMDNYRSNMDKLFPDAPGAGI